MDQLIAASKIALKSQKIEASYAKLAASPGTLFGPELGAFEQSERAKWGKIVKEKGIKAE
jgi:tripartite-type tricarboxylate transporter receptor subunit TctC